MQSLRSLPTHVAVAAVAAVVVVAASGAAGCASVQRGEDGRVHVLEPSLLASVPAAAQYGDEVTAVDEGAKAAELKQGLEAALPANVRERLVHDQRLDHVAMVKAQAKLFVSQRLSADLQYRLAWRLGIAAPIAGARSQAATGSSRLSVMDDFVVEMRDRLPTTGKFRYGIARALGGKKSAVAMVWIRDVVALEPVPKTAAPGATVTIKGRFLEDVKRPVLRMLEGDVVKEHPLTLDGERAFSVDVALGADAGTRWLDLHASAVDDPSQRAYVWLPLHVGVAEPSPPPVEAFGATTPSPENITAMLADMNAPLPARDAVLDDAAQKIALTRDGEDVPPPTACGKGWWWRRFGNDTLEEMRWMTERLPSVLTQLRAETRTRAGLVVVPEQRGVTSVIVMCTSAEQPAAPAAPAPASP